MATTTYSAQLGIVDASGNVNVIYPTTLGKNVTITANPNKTTATTVQLLATSLGALAFKNVSDLISASTEVTTTTQTWSGRTLNKKFTDLNSNLVIQKTNNFTSVANGEVHVTVSKPSDYTYIGCLLHANTYINMSSKLRGISGTSLVFSITSVGEVAVNATFYTFWIKSFVMGVM